MNESQLISQFKIHLIVGDQRVIFDDLSKIETSIGTTSYSNATSCGVAASSLPPPRSVAMESAATTLEDDKQYYREANENGSRETQNSCCSRIVLTEDVCGAPLDLKRHSQQTKHQNRLEDETVVISSETPDLNIGSETVTISNLVDQNTKKKISSVQEVLGACSVNYEQTKSALPNDEHVQRLSCVETIPNNSSVCETLNNPLELQSDGPVDQFENYSSIFPNHLVNDLTLPKAPSIISPSHAINALEHSSIMETTSLPTPGATLGPPLKLNRSPKRPDSLKIELLTTIQEDSAISGSGQRSSYSGGASNSVKAKDLHIGFRNITYSVREGLFRNRKRTLLNAINGDYYSGELTAIMGPSGSGKSTLMNILAGYTTSNVGGKLLINDEKREETTFRTNSCYIMQDDHLQPLLTVLEAMNVAANLKFSTAIPSRDKRYRVKDILDALGLWVCRKVKTHSLSGGQRKRLAIALELLKNPQVMFFDEPTSGLDSSSSKQCIMLLKQLAQEGKTVICTIHQPSATIFEMFDNLYAIAAGKCIYQGSVKGLIPYLEESGLNCPPYHNPADYLLEVATGEYGNFVEMLSLKSENGICKEWRKNNRNSLQLQSIEHIDLMMQRGFVTPVKAPPFIMPFILKRITQRTRELDVTPSCFKGSYPTSHFHQFYILLLRTFLILSRNMTLTYTRIGIHLLIALVIGILYYDIGTDASHLINNFNFIYFSLMFLMMTAFSCITTTFPSELPILIREHFNRWYSLTSYYLAVTLADIPIQVIATLIYTFTTYFMTSQPLESNRIFLYVIMAILISITAQSYGLVVGAALDVKNGVIFGPFALLPFLIFSGFFVQINDAHPYMRWLFHMSFLKYGFEGLILAIFGYDRGKIPCTAEYCHFVYPDKFLKEVDMSDAVYSHCVYFLIGISITLRVIAYLALQIQLRLKR